MRILLRKFPIEESLCSTRDCDLPLRAHPWCRSQVEVMTGNGLLGHLYRVNSFPRPSVWLPTKVSCLHNSCKLAWLTSSLYLKNRLNRASISWSPVSEGLSWTCLLYHGAANSDSYFNLSLASFLFIILLEYFIVCLCYLNLTKSPGFRHSSENGMKREFVPVPRWLYYLSLERSTIY